MSLEASPTTSVLPTGGYVSTVFVHGTVANQAAANSVYVSKSTIDADYGRIYGSNSGRVHTFKSDRERMQYLIGRIGSVPKCTGS
jgi:RPA family protein